MSVVASDPPPAVLSPTTMTTVAVAVLRRPGLWWTALGVMGRLSAPGWWRRRPYLPVPDRRLWAFRMVTAYGRPDAVPDAADVVSYLEWCRSTGTASRTPKSPGGHR